jgi:uncharacterized protein (TIGR00251 family)
VSEQGEGTIAVRVQPRAARDEIAGERGGRLLVRLTAPPVEGRANEALRRLLAGRLRIAPSRVTIVRGAGSRDKLVRVEGFSSAELATALGLRLGSRG